MKPERAVLYLLAALQKHDCRKAKFRYLKIAFPEAASVLSPKVEFRKTIAGEYPGFREGITRAVMYHWCEWIGFSNTIHILMTDWEAEEFLEELGDDRELFEKAAKAWINRYLEIVW